MNDTPRRGIDELLAIMARLRDPERGCPWDVQQDFASIAPYTIEEAYEVADAIDRGDLDDLREELGDLLLQIVFHAQMAAEQGHFDFDDVAQAISTKMVRRHPHVFGEARYADLAAQKQAWEELKAAERAARGDVHDASTLAGVSHGLPEWKRATKLQQRAATVGFDWPDHRPVLDKLAEEIDEVRAEFDAGADPVRLEDEIGDVLFVVANLARHAGVDFSRALRHANAKFERRFRRMEQLAAAAGGTLAGHDLAAQEALWRRAKREEG
ncbi:MULTISPECIES: nucleoside triphosphate pyrophosphohydrolase [Rhodanobacter]|uniref:Nucleoside triphosphate pyrophosphohydrolase n=1 Tax=Rhodanobacter hydrolyticus TaxID=2250595 RepID=A0ABW8J4K8_9GAMM|nr:nucleoside triphosphate pyrophosphohydrolase [Rhodanobacter sp. 7MK24]MBD8879081.1 nucleoside triphosphate pyrophosphohydrolase [Rhodanobacter sp. 7MK24]